MGTDSDGRGGSEEEASTNSSPVGWPACACACACASMYGCEPSDAVWLRCTFGKMGRDADADAVLCCLCFCASPRLVLSWSPVQYSTVQYSTVRTVIDTQTVGPFLHQTRHAPLVCCAVQCCAAGRRRCPSLFFVAFCSFGLLGSVPVCLSLALLLRLQ